MQIVGVRHFPSPYDPVIHFKATKVGGACSHLGSIGPKVGGALAPLALWLPRPWQRLPRTSALLIGTCAVYIHFSIVTRLKVSDLDLIEIGLSALYGFSVRS